MYRLNQLFNSPRYQAALLQQKRQYKRLIKEGHDVVLPPNELPLPIQASFVQAFSNEGNWANSWLMNGLIEEVKKNANGKILIHIVDTAYEAMNDYILPFYKKKYSTEHVGETGEDNNGHGHLCAGNLFAQHPNIPMGVIRVLAEAGLVDFCFHRGMGGNGSGSYTNINKAISAAANTNAPEYSRQIISMSFGGSSPNSEMETILQQASDAGIFLSAAAGNDGVGNGDTIGYPAKYDNVMAWGALKSTGERDYYSAIGPKLFGMAPGSNIISTTNSKNGLAYWNGTSGSNPIAVGVLSCISLMYPEIDSQSELEAFTVDYIKDLGNTGFDNYNGHGAPLLSGYVDKEPEPPTDDPEEPEDPEPPTEPTTRNERVCTFDFSNRWPMYWRTLSQTRLKVLTITDIRVQIKTSEYTYDVATFFKTSLDQFFLNRGLILPDEQDYQDATNYSQYFFDMLYSKQKNFDVLEIKGEDEQGNPITITEDEIIKWNRKINRLSVLPAKLFRYRPNID